MKPLDHAVATATKPESRVELKLPLTNETPAGQTDRSTTAPVDDSPYPVVGQVYDFMLPRAAREPDTSHGVILYLENLTVSFDGFRAIDDLSLYIDRGELRCIIGPNGAGKTTLMDIVTGKTRPDSGSAFFGRTVDLLRLSEPEIAQAGIGRKFQKPTVFEQHTVFENLELAMAGERRAWRLLTAKLNGEQHDRIDEVLDIIRLAEHRTRPAGALSHGQKQWLEIGMLLMQNPLLLLVDEPVAGMTGEEMEHTAELLKHLAGERSVVVVEHDMDFVRSIAEKVTVLQQGAVLAEGSMDEVQNDPRVVEVYLGE
jgi:urea transport system ATP-binding protein